MSVYREIRVRPVVRYVVTDFQCNEDYGDQKSISLGEFDNVESANLVANALAGMSRLPKGFGTHPPIVVEPARRLKIDWTRGPGEPREAIRWHLIDEDAPPPRV